MSKFVKKCLECICYRYKKVLNSYDLILYLQRITDNTKQVLVFAFKSKFIYKL